MDPLTPNKIQRLLHLAEDSSFNLPGKHKPGDLTYQHPPALRPVGHSTTMITKEGTCESSSGLLDLDQIQGFGESDAGSIGKSTGFFPNEMTGRSTGTEENVPRTRHSCFDIEALTKQTEEQSNQIHSIMRHSIATNFSLHSKNLTASEASFVAKYAPIPVQQTRTIIQEASVIDNMSIGSIGGYFRERCPDFNKILGQADSPDRSSMQPSLTEVSHYEPEHHQQYAKLDPSLDCVPVRQTRIQNEVDVYEKQAMKQQEQVKNLLANAYTKNIEVPADLKREMENKKIGIDATITEQFKTPIVAPKLEPQKPKAADFRKGAAGTSTEFFVKAVTRSSIRPAPEDTEGSMVDNSLSISKIADLLGNHSVVDVSDIIDKYCKKDKNKPLSAANKIPKPELPVTYLKDTRNTEPANSGSSVNTVISMKPNQENRIIPEVLVTRDSLTRNALREKDSIKSEQISSKSPSTKSRSTLSTVQENFAVDSPVRTSTGDVKPSHVPSPNYEYKELDKSVDWQEVLRQAARRQPGLAEEPWIEIKTTSLKGFVGVNCAATVSITTKSDNWLTATFSYDKQHWRHLRIELPRQPILLSPGKTEQLNINITSTDEKVIELPFTITVKDSTIDSEQEHNGNLLVDFKIPEIQAISSSGANKVVFSPTQERTLLATSLVLITESPADLQLSLSLVDGKNLFSLKNVQEIKLNEVNKILATPEEKHALSKLKKASSAVQLCRLTKGNAIRATVVFEAPCLSERSGTELEVHQSSVVVNLIGVDSPIKTVALSASVGVASLTLSAADSRLIFTKEPKILQVLNQGSLKGVWHIKVKSDENRIFNVSASKVDLAPGETKGLAVTYTGPEDSKGVLIFEEAITGSKTLIEIQGGAEKFPIKTSNPILSWVRSGRKEISLKNFSDKKVLVRCDIIGDAFTIDVPAVDGRGTSCIIGFSPNECRQLPIVYSPTTYLPSAATLFLKIDKNSDYSKKINLFGATGDALRWCGLATYGETALVRAVANSSIELRLTNKSPMPSFVCARVNFNLQYMSVAASSRLLGARHVVGGRGAHSVRLQVEWARVERRAQEARAATLATLTALTGPELTRHRILRILRQEGNGELDTSLLPDNLKMLVGPFEGEQVDMDSVLTDFHETKASLVDLIGGLQELKAQIDLPVDLSEETIIIADDTVVEHHTMFD